VSEETPPPQYLLPQVYTAPLESSAAKEDEVATTAITPAASWAENPLVSILDEPPKASALLSVAIPA
jgi:hypothetical protein